MFLDSYPWRRYALAGGLFLAATAVAGAAWPGGGEWVAAVTYRQAEDAVYFDTTGSLPPQVKIVAGTDPNQIHLELDDLRLNPPEYILTPRDGVINNIRLAERGDRNRYSVEVTVELAKAFRYDVERRQVEGGVSQIVLKLAGVDVARPTPEAAGTVPVWARPASDAQIVAYVPYHARVEVHDYAKEMYLVRTPEGALGWVREKNVKIEGENPFVKEAPPPAGLRDDILATAKKYLGVPYVWGGTSSRGFDCSGLVQTVFAENGLQLPRGSGDQYREGKKVPAGKMRPADLVFFHTYTSGPSHVGLYVGDGKFLHAESSPRGVTITPLDEPYWKERFLGARTWIPE